MGWREVTPEEIQRHIPPDTAYIFGIMPQVWEPDPGDFLDQPPDPPWRFDPHSTLKITLTRD